MVVQPSRLHLEASGWGRRVLREPTPTRSRQRCHGVLRVSRAQVVSARPPASMAVVHRLHRGQPHVVEGAGEAAGGHGAQNMGALADRLPVDPGDRGGGAHALMPMVDRAQRTGPRTTGGLAEAAPGLQPSGAHRPEHGWIDAAVGGHHTAGASHAGARQAVGQAQAPAAGELDRLQHVRCGWGPRSVGPLWGWAAAAFATQADHGAEWGGICGLADGVEEGLRTPSSFASSDPAGGFRGRGL